MMLALCTSGSAMRTVHRGSVFVFGIGASSGACATKVEGQGQRQGKSVGDIAREARRFGEETSAGQGQGEG